jgi:uncharacterized protein
MIEKGKVVQSTSFRDFDPRDWDALVSSDNVFQEYFFLAGLENNRCIGGRDWIPHIFQWKSEGKLWGSIVAYERNDSYGEYIFDFQWANAFQRAGIPYYPKFTIASPFTPVSGTRLLLHSDLSPTEKAFVANQLLSEVKHLGKSLSVSSIHSLYCTEEEIPFFESVGFSQRLSHQYHWWNKAFETFDDFLATLVKDRRKTIRQERRKIAESGLKIQTLHGDEINPDLYKVFYSFYADTHSKKWGNPYLNLSFFEEIFRVARHRMLLVLASRQDGSPVAGTLNFFKGDVVYGRYWGALEHIPNLHFECCYYQLIDFAIQNRLKRVEAGAQGEHKFLRGYTAEPQYSMHFIYNESGRAAIEKFLETERELESENIEVYNSHSPIKALRGEKEHGK